jgi:hypothetical protein
MAIGTIRAKFSDMYDAYPTWDRLPKYLADYMVELKKQAPEATSCCLQMSEALNATGQKVYPSSQRRPNARLGKNFYIHAVDELEHYLVGRYGATEDIKAGNPKISLARMKEYLAPRKGILVFRGKVGHTELWDGVGIRQRSGAPDPREPGRANQGVMDESLIFSNPRILFWEVTEAADPNPVPAWLKGWWSVYDGNQYYYYFSDQHGVFYTEAKPKDPGAPPALWPLNEGTVTMTDHGLVILWTAGVDPVTRVATPATKETFTRVGWTSEREMNGESNLYGPLFARKMT